jgi:hypothetical protein
MGDRSLTTTELNSLLAGSGHSLWRGNAEDREGVEVHPSPDLIVTVALNLDPCLRPAYRDHYFATWVDDDRFPLIGYEPSFDPPEPFTEAAARERRSYGAFMAGPVRWLIRRLMRFPRWLLWPEDQIRAPDRFVRERWALEEMPRLREWLKREPPVPPTANALILNPADASDCQVFWGVAEQVEAGFYNYYVSDLEGAEVYQIHHHSKITISIPDERERRRLLDDLSGYPDLLDDCSGYTSKSDEDEDEDETTSTDL